LDAGDTLLDAGIRSSMRLVVVVLLGSFIRSSPNFENDGKACGVLSGILKEVL
jgi:hypothetical protein